MRIHRQIINQLLSGMEQVSAIIHNKDLSPQEKVMMILIMQDCNLKNFSASDITEFPQRTVYESLSNLVEKGYLTKIKKGYACNVDFTCNEINNDIDRVALRAPKSRTIRGNDQSDFAVMEGQSQIDQPKPEPKKRSVFQVPTLLEVEQEFFEKTNDRDFAHMIAVKFWNFYDAKGWMVGKTKMQKWKSAVMTWLNKEQIQVSQPQIQSDYDENGNFIGF